MDRRVGKRVADKGRNPLLFVRAHVVLPIDRKTRLGLVFALAMAVSGSLAAVLSVTGCTTAEPEIIERVVETKRVVTVVVPVPETVERAVTVEVPLPQTVVVEREVTVEVPVPETVIVEREIRVPETVVVEREVIVELLVPETVVVEREVLVEVPVPETVIVEREVTVEVLVPETVVVERRVLVEVEKLVEIEQTVDPAIFVTATQMGDVSASVSEEISYDDFPRNRTLVISHWGDSYRAEHNNVENFNWWLPGNSHARHVAEKGLIEHLFYTNLNDGNIIPWLGESFQYNDSLDAVNVKIRKGVKWSDGVPFTAYDVKFTIDMVRNNAPHLKRSNQWNEMISGVDVHDDYNLTVDLSRPDPRFFQTEFGFGWENHVPVVPKHVWENRDPLTFTNYDPAKGWPLGTGAFKLSLSTPDVQLYDLRDDWWASEIGFHDPPKVERIKYIPVAIDDIATQLYIDNRLDAGPSLLYRTFESAKHHNDFLRSWHFEGPIWGAPDGCNYVLILNNQKEHFSDRDVRWAINHAIDRQEIIDLAHSGGLNPVTVPISSLGVGRYLPYVQDVIDGHNPDDPDPAKVESRMLQAGYSKDSEDFWIKDGERVEITLEAPSWIRPQLPVLEKQLRNGGFDAVVKTDDGATVGNRLRLGETEVVWVHCGSILEPYDTFKSYHSKNSAPAGENAWGGVQGGRYENPEMDSILDEFEGLQHSTEDPRYLELTRRAINLFLRDMPTIHIAEELHVVVQNTHYWTNWPGIENPYVSPYPPWNAWYLITLNLEPTDN